MMPKSRSRSRGDKGQDAKRRRAIAGDGGDNERAGVASRGVKPDGAVSPRIVKPRDSTRQQPIRLGGKSCLRSDIPLNDPSIDGLALSHTLPIPDADLTPSLNLREVTRAAKLTRLESRALLHTQRGIPLYKLAKVLGCRPCEAKRALETAQLKVRNLQRGGV